MSKVETPKDAPFLSLECIRNDKTEPKVVYVLLPDAEKREFRVGRGCEADIKLGDSKISRSHATIKFVPENGFFLKDNESRYGTLVECREVKITPDEKVAIQIGNTVLGLKVKDPTEIDKENVKKLERISSEGLEYVSAHALEDSGIFQAEETTSSYTDASTRASTTDASSKTH